MRQSLNCTLPWHKGYQSGDYTKNKVLLGCLLDGFPEERDLIDTSGVIIMNIGGGRDVVVDGTRANKRERQSDQGRPKMLQSAINAKEMNQYVGIVVGESCTLMPSKVPHAYNALDWYFVTDIWCEKNKNGFKFWKMRLEVTNPANPVWWAPVNAPEPSRPQPGDFVAGSRKCEACEETSKKLFSHAWTCLNYDCPKCFDFDEEVEFGDLRYSEEFLKQRTAYTGKLTSNPDTGVEFPPSIAPPIPTLGDGDTGTEVHMGQGICCPRCFGCSPRSHWAGWFCETPGCGFKLECSMRSINITDISNDSIWRKARRASKVEQHPAMVGMATNFECGGYAVTVYPLLNLIDNCDTESVVGVLAHLRPSPEVRAAPNGPDDSFRDLHEHAAKDDWKRLPVRLKGKKQQMLTSHFAQNYGAQYKYVVSVGSKSFSDAPDPVLRALLRMRWAGHKVIEHAKMSITQLLAEGKVEVAPSLGFEFVEFNELLGLGYFEGNKINWHDDGEDTLGPTVATVSLGSPSTLSFRPKIKAKGRTKRSNGSVLDMQLLHGDIVVMHGTEIHRCYEHRVIPHGNRRFALTSRHIDLSKLDTDEERELSKELGTLPERANDPDFQPVDT
ncbi:uncharacterized protein DNG_03009 [Cephalotrichum gorgonifer]|uniref:Fe2OG dioxygenase domain-containing protein n=1 Tax=Cephalotrichum gorgonifer TaxID=2041049 RepID=A0AAE8MUX8_9PEZI|nr:uncharacterized protein DNG_03009 [Cephalotrichum gorgonifer]